MELYGHIIRGNFEEAVELLEMPSGSVRLKVGRPDITSSVFSVHGAHEVRGVGDRQNNRPTSKQTR